MQKSSRTETILTNLFIDCYILNQETFPCVELVSRLKIYSKKCIIMTACPGRNKYVEYRKIATVATSIESKMWVKEKFFIQNYILCWYMCSNCFWIKKCKILLTCCWYTCSYFFIIILLAWVFLKGIKGQHNHRNIFKFAF